MVVENITYDMKNANLNLNPYNFHNRPTKPSIIFSKSLNFL